MQNSKAHKVVIKKPSLPEYQRAMLYCPEKHTICEATTKAGKTYSHMFWLFEQAHTPPKRGAIYWWVAPIYSQAKIAFTRMKRVVDGKKGYSVNLTHLSITTPMGSIIEFKSGENPDSLYGEDVQAVVLDEVSRMKEDAFFAVRSTITATQGRMKLIGNVKGTGNWAYKLARRVEAGELPDWKYFKITADDAIKANILSQQSIDEARAIYPTGIFLELYYGIPFISSSNRFAFSYDKERHIASCEVDPNYPVWLSFDFNINPICCVVCQIINGRITVPHCIMLENSDIYKMCAYIKNKFNIPGKTKPTFIVTGDATGRASSALVKDHMNYYRIIKNELQLSIQQMKQPTVNPRIEDNQVLLNAILEHMPVSIDPTNASALIFDLEFMQMNPDGTMRKGNRNDPTQRGEGIDAWRYFLNTNFSRYVSQLHTQPDETRRPVRQPIQMVR